jgi:hypothetical protein
LGGEERIEDALAEGGVDAVGGDGGVCQGRVAEWGSFLVKRRHAYAEHQIMDELSHSILLLSQEIHELHKQLASDSQDYRDALEADVIYANLLHQSSRIYMRLNRLDSATPKPTT